MTPTTKPELARQLLDRVEAIREEVDQATNQTHFDHASRELKEAREAIVALVEDIAARPDGPVKLIDLEGQVITLRVGTARDRRNSFWGDIAGRVRVVRADGVTIWVGNFAIDSEAIVEPSHDPAFNYTLNYGYERQS